MNFIDRWERSKFGRFGVPNLMKYVIAINGAGLLLGLMNPSFYFQYLSLDFNAIFHGQIWRLFTFMLCPSAFSSGNEFINLFWFLIWAQVYYMIGTNLERMWGTFRFTLFYFSGVLEIILVTLIFYLFMLSGDVLPAYVIGINLGMGVSFVYLNQTLFLMFALLFPDTQFLVYFVIPVKAKWMAALYLVLTGYDLVQALYYGVYYAVALIGVSLINLVLFLWLAKGAASPRQAVRRRKRRVEFQYKAQPKTSGLRHRCAICGRTEADAPDLDFRYCSKCEGDFEYCSEHLFTHEHVRHD